MKEFKVIPIDDYAVVVSDEAMPDGCYSYSSFSKELVKVKIPKTIPDKFWHSKVIATIDKDMREKGLPMIEIFKKNYCWEFVEQFIGDSLNEKNPHTGNIVTGIKHILSKYGYGETVSIYPKKSKVFYWVNALDELPKNKGRENSVVVRSNCPRDNFTATGFTNYDEESPALYIEVGNRSLLTVAEGAGNLRTTIGVKYVQWLKEIETSNQEKWRDEDLNAYYEERIKHDRLLTNNDAHLKAIEALKPKKYPSSVELEMENDYKFESDGSKTIIPEIKTTRFFTIIPLKVNYDNYKTSTDSNT